MKELIKSKKFRPIVIRINPELDKYDNIVLFPEKLARANEMLAKHGLPKEWQADYDKIIREKSFWVRGILNEADAETLTFSIHGKAAGSKLDKAYTITASDAETLTTFVKTYWNETVKVHIKPKDLEDDSQGYALIESMPIDKRIVIAE